MKRFWLLVVLWTLVILSWCSLNQKNLDVPPDEPNSQQDVIIEDIVTEEHEYLPTDKPSINSMDNFNAIVNWYVKDWEMNHTITKENLYFLDDGCRNITIKWWGKHTQYSNTFKKSEIKEWNNVTLNGTYKFDDSKLQLTDEEKSVLAERWWNIIPADRYENFYKLDYSEGSAEDEAYRGSEEWVKLYSTIWWSKAEYERYPGNTILITNDLLLHSFHKLFDNTLKYYEQTVARDTIKDLSNKLFNKFVDLSESETDKDLKNTYEFLAAYWSVPAILLRDSSEFRGGSVWGYWLINNDQEIKGIIRNSEEEYLNKLSSWYKETIENVIEEILSASTLAESDPFLYSFSPRFIVRNRIMQDYTQFQPRSHYTDNAELKTYFMAMKWLMREKFYFGDKNLTNAALIMVNNISSEDVEKLSELSAKIKKLIWWDDDLTLESLTKWMKENNINSTEKIKNLTKAQRNELYNIVPQKIQSSAYKRDVEVEWTTTAQEAKEMTAGFVFFWEKFTLDSYLFDLVTAGSAEEEFKIMPKKQTALIVPDILQWNWDAAKIVDLWLKEWVEKEKRLKNEEYILEDNKHTQYSSYNDVKQKAKEMVEKQINETTVMDSVYHKWLNMIWLLIDEVEENAPYFKLDPIYKLKNLVTYMWSYTELKHDTLLYVKQAYSFGMNDAGIGFDLYCDITVNPPSLPVPKWYIEADMDIIDKLIEVNAEVKLDFEELWQNVESKFIWFDDFLNHTKNILQQQKNNEEISDEDFEWMRVAYDKLSDIVYPFWKEPSRKEMRAALIADIFTSEYKGKVDPLYEAVGRPALMLVMVGDVNWNRIAIWPVFTHYEFYDSDNVIDAKWSRLNDLQWQAAYDDLNWEKLESATSIISRELYKWLKSE